MFKTFYLLQVNGFVEDLTGIKVATLFGKWDDSIHYSVGDGASKAKDCNSSSDSSLLWKRNKPPANLTRYNLTSFALTLNELTTGLRVERYSRALLSLNYVFL